LGVLTGAGALALLAAGVLQDPPRDGLAQAWKDTWAQLAHFAGSAPGSPEHERLRRELEGFQARHERSARKSHEREEAFRARLLRAHLSRLAGVGARPLPEPGTEIGFMTGEAWLAAQVLGPGPTRVTALRLALAEGDPAALPERLDRTARAAEEDARLLNLDWALDEARMLHRRASSARSARLLGGLLRLRGEYELAARITAEAIEAERDPVERGRLLAEHADAIAASGDEDAFLAASGAALASGSREAAFSLALRALGADEPVRARALFRGLLEEGPFCSSAGRGYGLALLAGSPASAQPAAPLALEKP